MTKTQLSVLVFAGLMTSNLRASSGKKPAPVEVAETPKLSPNAERIAGQALVSFTTSDNAAARAEIVKRFKAIEVEKVGSSELYLFQIPPAQNLDAALLEIKKIPGVRFAESNLQMHTFQGGSAPRKIGPK